MATMNAVGHDTFEIKYADSMKGPRVEYSRLLNRTQQLVDELKKRKVTDITISYYSTYMVEPAGAVSPGHRFGEIFFEDIDLVSELMLKESRCSAISEFDQYMAITYGATLAT